MLKLSADAIDLGRKYNLPVAYVTEDTTPVAPRGADPAFPNAVDHGAHRLIVCDPSATRRRRIKNLLKFTRTCSTAWAAPTRHRLARPQRRGLGVVNSIFAIAVRRGSTASPAPRFQVSFPFTAYDTTLSYEYRKIL